MVLFPIIKGFIQVILISLVPSNKPLNCKVEAKPFFVFFSQNCRDEINQNNTVGLKVSERKRNL